MALTRERCRERFARDGLCWSTVLLVVCAITAPLEAQRVDRMPRLLIETVMPGADRFTAAGGNPPVISAYRGAGGTETLLGYVFLTSDLPPEQFGYSGPIEALVGMRPDGTITGMRVTDYRESYMSSMGDFLRTPGFQEQFAGKHIGDPFQLWGDVEGISRVSISVRALSRGVRDAARRVANAYGFESTRVTTAGAVTDPYGLSWFQLRQLGLVQRFEVTEAGQGTVGIALASIGSERFGEYLLGAPLYERAHASAERRGGAENLMLYAIDGSRLRLFHQQGWSIVQGGDTAHVDPRNVVSLGLPSGGIVSGEATMVGIMLVDGSVDTSQPFEFVYDAGEFGVHTVEYVGQEARIVLAEAAAAAAAAAPAPTPAETQPDRAPPETREALPSTSTAGAEGSTPVADVADPAAPPPAAPDVPVATDVASGADALPSVAPQGAEQAEPALDFVLSEDESLLERTLAGASWGRVALLLFVLALATAAFFSKIPTLRWVSLSATLVVLGFLDGGFLSVSHITSGIWAGVGVYLRDIPLLILVVFTVVSTLLWGRVFCGFLCPFGALQDFIDRVVPRSLKRPLPRHVHDRAIYLKYGILALIVLPALMGSNISLYQYFEPFGTVFFLSPSLLLWSIAGAILVASVVVPRFYCRYACPLGAALAVLSRLSLRRIERVDHCQLCMVCEQKCPTGAIRGPVIDFPECVRCNVCEVQLIEKTGVCRHDLADIRPRLVQLRVGASAGAADA